jgi:hemerythrin-like domain-containing protein
MIPSTREATVSAITAKTVVNPIASWHAEHVYFKRLLDLLHGEVEMFESGERPNYELMLDIITYLREYSDRLHHPREDVAFERLARYRPELAPLLARLHQEHRVIANAGEALERLLSSIMDDSLVPRAKVETAAATYLVYYGNHMAKEDEQVLERASRLLTAEDWQAVRNAAVSAPDPLFGDTPAERYRALRRHIGANAH